MSGTHFINKKAAEDTLHFIACRRDQSCYHGADVYFAQSSAMHVVAELVNAEPWEGPEGKGSLEKSISLNLGLGGQTLATLAHTAVDRAEASAGRVTGSALPHSIHWLDGPPLDPRLVARHALSPDATVRVIFGSGPETFPNWDPVADSISRSSPYVYALAEQLDLESTGARELVLHMEDADGTDKCGASVDASSELADAHAALVARCGMLQIALLWNRFGDGSQSWTLDDVSREEVHALLSGTHTRSFGRQHVDESIVAAKTGCVRERHKKSEQATHQYRDAHTEIAMKQQQQEEEVEESHRSDEKQQHPSNDAEASALGGKMAQGDELDRSTTNRSSSAEARNEPLLPVDMQAMEAAENGLRFHEVVATIAHSAACFYECHTDALSKLDSKTLVARVSAFCDSHLKDACATELERAVKEEAERIGESGRNILMASNRLLRRAASLCQTRRLKCKEATLALDSALSALHCSGLYSGEVSRSDQRMLSALLFSKYGSSMQSAVDMGPLYPPFELEPEELSRLLGSIAYERYQKKLEMQREDAERSHEEPERKKSENAKRAAVKTGENEEREDAEGSDEKHNDGQREQKRGQGAIGAKGESAADEDAEEEERREEAVEMDSFATYLGNYLDELFKHLGVIQEHSGGERKG